MKDNIRHIFRIESNMALSHKTWEMVLTGNTTTITNPGQFVNIEIPGKFLRRPISVADFNTDKEGRLTLLYDIVGDGTKIMSELKNGDTLDILTGLGNGFDLEKSGSYPLLSGGGIGVAPLYALAKHLISRGAKPTVVLGFNSANDVVYEEEFRATGTKTIVTTADGSYGEKGFVTDAIRRLQKEKAQIFNYYYACGPMPMLRAMHKSVEIPGELSLDERMGCGFGACMCCSIMTKSGPKSICKDGPVFEAKELEF